jgi:hypothetical protein
VKHTAGAAVLAVSWFIGGTPCQVADGGVSGSAAEYCAQAEPIHPNFRLAEDVLVRGRITDQQTAPLQNSPVELRRFISERKQVTMKKVSTDVDGKFDLGLVKHGDYRLLLSPHRGFKQPEKLECSSTKGCTVNAVLILNPTDQPAAACPIR